MNKSSREILVSHGKIQDLDRGFDIYFWQEQGPEAIFKAAWELVVNYATSRGMNESELRLQRSVVRISATPD